MKKYLKTVVAQFKELFFRFPVATLFCVLSFLIFVGEVADWDILYEIEMQSAVMVSTLGFVLSLCAGIFAEDKEWKSWRKRIDVLVIPLMVGYFFWLIQNNEISHINGIAHIIFSLVAMSLLSIASFSTTKSPIILWQYNVKMLWQLLLATICAVIFFSGFALALSAVQVLFDILSSGRSMGYLSAFFFSLFLPLFFAAGIPTKTQIHEAKKFPVLKIIGQYILIPILATYLIIIYAYGLKILFIWELPKGMLSWLILVSSGAGLLIFFMLHNLYVTKATKISTLFGKWFFYLKLPLLGLLFLAILRRVADYGITESRYYVLLAACWLLGITIYIIISKGRTVRPIIISFIIVALCSLVGPWSVFSVSQKSQYNRLEKILAENDLLENGKFSNDSTRVISKAVSAECKDIFYFFASKNNVEYLQPLFTCDLAAICKSEGRWNLASTVFSKVEIAADTEEPFVQKDYFLTMQKAALSTSGYDFFIYYEYYSWEERKEIAESELMGNPHVVVARQDAIIELYSSGSLYKTFDLKKLATKIASRLSDDSSSQTLSYEQLSVVEQHCRIVFKNITGNLKEGNIDRAEMYIFWNND